MSWGWWVLLYLVLGNLFVMSLMRIAGKSDNRAEQGFQDYMNRKTKEGDINA